MFTSTIINLVILLAFTYFLGSTMVSAVNEAILGMFNQRSKYLKKALTGLFENAGWKGYINGTLINERGFFESTHIKSLYKVEGKIPSYIPFQNFLLTLIEYVSADNYQSSFREAIKNSDKLNVEVKKALLEIAAKSKSRVNNTVSDVMAFEQELEQYYNNTMDRATGWYKRATGILLFVLAIVLSVSLNIDTIKIVNEGLKNPQKLEVAAENVSRFVQENDSGVIKLPNGEELRVEKRKTKENNAATTTVDKDKEGQPNPDSAMVANSNSGSVSKPVKEISLLHEAVTGYQFGYNDGGFCKEWGANFVLKLLGITITCFALQMGSQFWFDTLNKVVNLRSTGKKPADSRKET